MQRKNATMTEQIDQMNGEAINRANELANLKADADALRNKLADTEAALGRANAELGAAEGALGEMDDLRTKLADTEAALGRANSEKAVLRHELIREQGSSVHLASVCRWLSDHPWRNLWAWVKRKLGCAE